MSSLPFFCGQIMKMIIVVVVIYTVCWLPLHVITLAGDLDPSFYSRPHMNIIWLCAHWLAMSHSCYNPFVYFWMNARFRNSFKKVLNLCHLIKMAPDDDVLFRAVSCDGEMSSTQTGSCRSGKRISTYNGRCLHPQYRLWPRLGVSGVICCCHELMRLS